MNQGSQYAKQDFQYFELAFLMVVVYTAAALVPFPPYDQYFDSPLVPFLLPFVAEGLRVVSHLQRRWLVLLGLFAPLFLRGQIRVAGTTEPSILSISNWGKIDL